MVIITGRQDSPSYRIAFDSTILCSVLRTHTATLPLMPLMPPMPPMPPMPHLVAWVDGTWVGRGDDMDTVRHGYNMGGHCLGAHKAVSPPALPIGRVPETGEPPSNQRWPSSRLRHSTHSRPLQQTKAYFTGSSVSRSCSPRLSTLNSPSLSLSLSLQKYKTSLVHLPHS
jgi:hypothetical protein